LSPRTRWLIVGLLLGILAQVGTGLVIHHRGPGWAPSSIAAHYRGQQVDLDVLSNEEMQRALAGDPAFIDRPAKTVDALLDIAHMHLAFMPLIVFLVAHLFSMAPFAKAPWAGALCYLTLIAALVDIATPFAIRWGSPSFAWLKLGAVIILEAGMIIMGVSVVIGCLRSGKAQSAPPSPNASNSAG
jgi:hypothetical protein